MKLFLKAKFGKMTNKWYIIIILTLVYWSLYKIIKEYSWSYFNKQEGFLLVLNSTFFFKIQRFIYINANA